MEIQIEFGGFYGYHEENINHRLHDWGDVDFEYVDWNATFKSYAKNWLHRFNNDANLSLEFVGIDSPKFYNYRTDRIVANVTNDDINKMLQYTKMEEFQKYADEQLTSYSGFISFFDNLDELLRKAYKSDDDMALLLGLICDYIIDAENVNEDIYELEYEIIELNDKTIENE
jgi:hypothetical protein